MTVIPVDFRPNIVIATKHKTYVLPPDAVGVPVEQRWPGIKLPASLQGSKVWQTEDGPVIARPEVGPP